MRVFLTGGGGFLGRAIAARLRSRGHAVRVFDAAEPAGEKDRGLEWHRGDITQATAVADAAAACDAIVHLVGVMTPACRDDPLRGAAINVVGTLNVFEAAKRHGIAKVVYTSSGGVYGPDDDRTPFPTTHYGAFKLANEGSARAYWEDCAISSLGFRPFVVYGPGREVGLTAGPSIACRAAAEGTRYRIGLTGRMGLVYVDDVAKAYVAAVERPFTGAHTVNLPGHVATVEQVVAILRRLVPGADIDCEGPSLPSIATAVDEWTSPLLGLDAQASLEEGLRLTIEHYRASVVRS
jgi:nucleoside-diphosphate-sugar epimerase